MKTVPSCYDWGNLYPQLADEPKQFLQEKPNFAYFHWFVITVFQSVITNALLAQKNDSVC
jgi:hypothetical protein